MNTANYEFQVRRNFQWVFASYTTYRKDRKAGYGVRKRQLGGIVSCCWDDDNFGVEYTPLRKTMA